METIGQAINELMNAPMPVFTIPIWLATALTFAVIGIIIYMFVKSIIIVD